MIIVFWLLVHTGASYASPPVFLPEPFHSLEACTAAGNAFKDSPMDLLESGIFTCIPQERAK